MGKRHEDGTLHISLWSGRENVEKEDDDIGWLGCYFYSWQNVRERQYKSRLCIEPLLGLNPWDSQ